MSNIDQAVRELRKAAGDLEQRLAGVRQAIAALEGKPVRSRSSASNGSGRRRLSKAGREAISKAAKQRWASYRRAKGAK